MLYIILLDGEAIYILLKHLYNSLVECLLKILDGMLGKISFLRNVYLLFCIHNFIKGFYIFQHLL